MKTGACKDGTLQKQPNRVGMTLNTFTPSLQSCAILFQTYAVWCLLIQKYDMAVLL